MFDWHEYLQFAEGLFNNQVGSVAYSKELRLRNCVSRAYYSSYCQTRNFCERKKIFSPRGVVEDHHDLIETCKRHPNFDVKEIGKHLHWLRDRRNDCDYENDLARSTHTKNLQTTADQAIDRATSIVRDLIGKLESSI